MGVGRASFCSWGKEPNHDRRALPLFIHKTRKSKDQLDSSFSRRRSRPSDRCWHPCRGVKHPSDSFVTHVCSLTAHACHVNMARSQPSHCREQAEGGMEVAKRKLTQNVPRGICITMAKKTVRAPSTRSIHAFTKYPTTHQHLDNDVKNSRRTWCVAAPVRTTSPCPPRITVPNTAPGVCSS